MKGILIILILLWCGKCMLIFLFSKRKNRKNKIENREYVMCRKELFWKVEGYCMFGVVM